MSRLIGIISLSLAMFANIAFANELTIVKITNDEDREITHMNVVVDENFDITEFKKLKYDRNMRLLAEEDFSPQLGYAGEVLEARRGKDVVILRGLNVTPENGGALEIDFLYNGITGSRGKFVVELDRVSDGWQITHEGRIVKHLHLVSNKKMFVGTIGIKRVKIIE